MESDELILLCRIEYKVRWADHSAECTRIQVQHRLRLQMLWLDLLFLIFGFVLCFLETITRNMQLVCALFPDPFHLPSVHFSCSSSLTCRQVRRSSTPLTALSACHCADDAGAIPNPAGGSASSTMLSRSPPNSIPALPPQPWRR